MKSHRPRRDYSPRPGADNHLLAFRLARWHPPCSAVVAMSAKKAAKKAAKPAAPLKATAKTPAAKIPAKKGGAKIPAKKAAAPKKAAKAAAGKQAGHDIAVAAYLNYRSRVEQGLPGDHIGDWLAAEKTPDI